MSKNPCTICENYMRGRRCEQAAACPVGILKAENIRLKQENRRLRDKVNEYQWGNPSRVDFDAMGRQGVFG